MHEHDGERGRARRPRSPRTTGARRRRRPPRTARPAGASLVVGELRWRACAGRRRSSRAAAPPRRRRRRWPPPRARPRARPSRAASHRCGSRRSVRVTRAPCTPGDDLVVDRVELVGPVLGGRLARSPGPNRTTSSPTARTVVVAAVDDDLVHADPPDDRPQHAAEQHPHAAAAVEGARHAVGVPDGDQGERGLPRRRPGVAVGDALARRHPLGQRDAGAQRHRRAQRALAAPGGRAGRARRRRCPAGRGRSAGRGG